MLRTLIYFHVYIILDFPIAYRNASVICQSEGTCLHKTVNMVVFFIKSIENTYPKGSAIMQMYRVVPQTKEGSQSRHFQTLYEMPYLFIKFQILLAYKYLSNTRSTLY